MRVLTVGGGKGGAGKTMLVRNLAPLLAKHWRVLAIDGDSQGGLTLACGVQSPAHTLAEVMVSKATAKATIQKINSFSLISANRQLAEAELIIAGKIGRESILRKALAAIANDFDVVLIDSGPSLGLMSVNALTASNGVICIVRPQGQDLAALGEYLQTVSQVREAINPTLTVIGVVANEYSAQMNHHVEAVEAITHEVGAPILGTIGRSVRVAESAALGQALADYDRSNPRVEEIEAVAKGIERWLKNQQSRPA